MTPVLSVPLDIMNKAAADPTGPEAQSIAILTQNVANMHAGEENYVMLPSDTHDNTSIKEYDIEFKGITGS